MVGSVCEPTNLSICVSICVGLLGEYGVHVTGTQSAAQALAAAPLPELKCAVKSDERIPINDVGEICLAKELSVKTH